MMGNFRACFKIRLYLRMIVDIDSDNADGRWLGRRLEVLGFPVNNASGLTGLDQGHLDLLSMLSRHVEWERAGVAPRARSHGRSRGTAGSSFLEPGKVQRFGGDRQRTGERLSEGTRDEHLVRM